MNILALNGGGAKGYFSICFLIEFAKRFNGIGGFKMISGASTGAIIAAGFALGISPELLKGYYRQMLSKIFDKNIAYPIIVKYDIDNLRKCLKSVFKDAVFADCKTNLSIITTDLTHCRAKIYKSFEEHDKNESVVEAVVKSCAAPTYFLPPVDGKIQYCDGGVAMNNPAFPAHTDAVEYFKIANNNILNLKLSTEPNLKKITKFNTSAISPTIDGSLTASDSMSEHFCKVHLDSSGGHYCLIENQNLTNNMDDCSSSALDKYECLAKESFDKFLRENVEFQKRFVICS